MAIEKFDNIYVIGDIHGEYAKLKSLLKNISFNEVKDCLVFVGDYIDRGSDPNSVLSYAVERYNEPNYIFLKGNHEQMMLDEFVPKYCQSSDSDKYVDSFYNCDWELNGGHQTRKLLENDPKFDLYLEFLNSLKLYYRDSLNGDDYYFCHAGVNPAYSLSEQHHYDLLWIRYSFFNYYLGKTIIVSGHTPTRKIEKNSSLPIIKDNMILVDTGACYGFKLSCVELRSKAVQQSS